MEVLSSCQIDGLYLDTRRFSILNDGSSRGDELFQSQAVIDQWHEIFTGQESIMGKTDGPTLPYPPPRCVQIPTVGARWRECAFVLLPNEPLDGTRALAANQQRLLGVSVGAEERLSLQELVERVRHFYGTTTPLQGQTLQRYGGVGEGEDDGNFACKFRPRTKF